MIQVKALSDKEIIEKVTHIVSSTIPVSTLILFGSRAKGGYKSSSDYDFAIKSSKIGIRDLSVIRDAVDQLNTLKNIEIIDYNDLDDDFKVIIDSQGETLYDSIK